MARSCRRQVLHVLHDRGRGGPARRNAFALARAAALEDSPEDSPEARAPQSVQSVPREQSVYSAPGPPSSQPPSLAYRHVSVQSPAAGGGGDGDGGGGGGRGRGGGGGDGDGGGGGGATVGRSEAQMLKPPDTTLPSDCHVIESPVLIRTLMGALSDPRYCVDPKLR